MPQQQTQDPVDRFIALPPDKQRETFEKLSPNARRTLIDKVKAKKNPAVTATPPESTLTKIGRGAALGAFEGAGIKPSTTSSEVISGSLSQLGTGIKQTLTKDYQEARRHGFDPIGAATAAATSFPARVVENAATGLEQTAASAGRAIQNKDWESASEHIASGLVSLMLLKQAKKVPDAATADSTAVSTLKKIGEKGVPPSITKAATKPVVQRFLFDGALKVKENLKTAAKAADVEQASRWKYIENTIDEAKPEGSINIKDVRDSVEGAIQERVKIPQKIPGGVEMLREAPESLDPEASSIFPRGSDLITFGQARQLRTRIGKETFGYDGKLTGELHSVGVKAYNDLTEIMRKSSSEHGMPGAFDDANKLTKEYLESFVDKGSPLARSLNGKNPSQIMEPLSSGKTAEQARRIMARYRQHGIDTKGIEQHGVVFQRLKSGLPEQLRVRPWEITSDVLGAASGIAGLATGDPKLLTGGAGALYTPVRLGYNVLKRAGAIREVKNLPELSSESSLPSGSSSVGPESNIEMERRGAQPPAEPTAHSNTAEGAARHAQALKMASEQLGAKATVRDLLKRADEIERRTRGQ